METIKCPACKFDEATFFLISSKKSKFWKCNRCELVFKFPPMIATYEGDCWTKATDPDGTQRDLTKEQNFKLKNWYGGVVQFIQKMQPGKVIDYGCGLGYLLSALPKSWEKYGFDISKFSQSFIKQNFPEIIIVHDLQLDVSEPLKHHLEKYDVVVSYHVIEHILDPHLFLKRLIMLVKPGGILIIGTPNIGCISAKIFKGNFRMLSDDSHLSFFSDKTLQKLLEKNNFTIIKKEYPYFKTDYFNLKNIIRMINPRKISPPFYGNIMTFYAKKNK